MTHQIQWRVRIQSLGWIGPWTDLEYESWPNPIHAEDRLKYWSHLSLSSLLEFRVVAVELDTK